MNNKRVPLFVINGFLESGKSTFIREAILRDPELAKERVVIICCEEGEVEFDDLPNYIHICVFENKSDYTSDALLDIDEKYRPTYVIIEYNGVWGMNLLYDTPMPYAWNMIAQFTVINAETFDVYFNNMKSIFTDMLRLSSRVYMNRCTRDNDFKLFRDSIKACAPRTEIMYMSDEEGPLDITLEDDLPYDLNSEVIVLTKDSYIIWYADMLDYPERYLGKTVEFSAQASVPKYCREGYFVAGNMVMTCCENDLQFFGVLCKYDGVNFPKNESNIKLRAEIRYEFAPEYGKKGPVLYVSKVTSMLNRKKKKK